MAIRLKVTGMSCAACSARVERAVGELPTVSSCSVNLLTGDLTVEGSASFEEIKARVVGAGYGIAENAPATKSSKNRSRLIFYRLLCSVVLSLALSYISMGHMVGLPLPALLAERPILNAVMQMALAVLVMIINNRFFISGARALFRLSPNMDTLVAMGSFVSFAYSAVVTVSAVLAGTGEGLDHGLYFESAAMILTLITVGKLLEAVAKGRTGNALDSLARLAPSTACVVRDGIEVEIPASELSVGDVFVVRAGESFPTDGLVIDGDCEADESMLTGEGLPKGKGVGDEVFAATINTSGFVRCRATSVGEDTLLSGIIRLVREAGAGKAPIAALADRVSGIFVPVVIALSLLTFGGWMLANGNAEYAVARAISVLVISCPCALGLATPVAIMVGGGVGATRGILFKSAAVLEQCGRIKTVVLDKTGTVTHGKPTVTDIVTDGISRERLFSLALGIESFSDHPLARAIAERCRADGASAAELSDFAGINGRGVSAVHDSGELFAVSARYAEQIGEVSAEIRDFCASSAEQGKTVIVLLLCGRSIGAFALSDTPEDGAADGVGALRAMGLRVVMLTGDNRGAAEYIAKTVGIDEVIAEVLPEGKEEVIRSLSEDGCVCMVGDGINDAPALTRADVGIAVGRGTDIAIESADVVLMHGGVAEVANAIDIGRSTLRVIRQNLFFAFLYNCIGIPMAMGLFGFALPPTFGALAMSLSSFSVVMNALRLNLRRPRCTDKVATRQQPQLTEEKKEPTTKEFVVRGMMCAHCEAKVKEAVEKIDGVLSATPSHSEKKLTVTTLGELDDKLIIDAVVGAGFRMGE